MTDERLIDDPLAALEWLSAHGEDVWENACSYGLSLAESGDNVRYELGDLALLVSKEYGRDRIGEFAKAIKTPVKRVQEYRTVCRYYPKAERRRVLADCPALSYSHLREAMRLNDVERSLAVLELANEDAWSVEKMGVEIAKQRGKPGGPVKLWEGPVFAGEVTRDESGFVTVTLTFLDDAGGLFPMHQSMLLKAYAAEMGEQAP